MTYCECKSSSDSSRARGSHVPHMCLTEETWKHHASWFFIVRVDNSPHSRLRLKPTPLILIQTSNYESAETDLEPGERWKNITWQWQYAAKQMQIATVPKYRVILNFWKSLFIGHAVHALFATMMHALNLQVCVKDPEVTTFVIFQVELSDITLGVNKKYHF